jgi:Domain of unknown function (DUF4136)
VRTLLVVLALGLVLAAGGCSQVSIQSDFDPAANFSGLQTYAWYAAEQPESGDPRVDDPLLDDHVRTSVENALNSRGYTKVDANPDFQLIYHAAVSKEIEVTTTSTPVYPRGYYGWRTIGAPVWVERPVAYTYERGSLILDIIDAQNERMVWRGSIQAELDRTATPQVRMKRIDAAVREMVAKFPPQPAQ